jgi:hypothetical protein
MSEPMYAYPEADCNVSGVQTPEFREAGGILGRAAPSISLAPQPVALRAISTIFT